MTNSPTDLPPLVLADDRAIAEVHVARGGGIGRYGVKVGSAMLDILRPDPARPGNFALGCNVLVPFSNRISGGGFHHERQFHRLSPNLPGNGFPTHGNGFQSRWELSQAQDQSVVLGLQSDGPGPFRYTAELVYGLEDGALRMTLRVRNTGATSLPFGAGFHPWFVRTPQARLTMAAAGFWSEDDQHLPLRFHPRSGSGDWDFSASAPLPQGWINSAFTGWDGEARLDWPERGWGVTLRADVPLTTLIIYSPSSAADFVCLEPVSHSVNAHNRSGPGTAPPQVLQPGESLLISALITPDEVSH
jgi:aldose 1-epimerase